MMKSTMKYISAAALMLAMAACSNDENLDSTYTNDPDAVRINATVGEGIPITRSNPIGTTEEQATFKSGDQIAVAAGTQAAVTYQYSGTAWTPAAGQYLKWETDPMNFFAYYPVGNGISMDAFTLPTDQSTLEKLTTADYMTCAATGVAKATNINLTLLRKTARIVISGITLNDQFEVGYTVSDIKVSGNSTGYTGGIVQTGNTIQVTSCLTGTGADSKFYALLTPTTADANATFLTLTVKKTADNTTQELVVKGIPATEAGMSYTYTLAVGKNLVQVGNVTVENWTDGTPIGGGEAIPLVEVAPATHTLTLHKAGALTTGHITDALNGGTTLIVNGTSNVADMAVLTTAPSLTAIDLRGMNYSGISGTLGEVPTANWAGCTNLTKILINAADAGAYKAAWSGDAGKLLYLGKTDYSHTALDGTKYACKVISLSTSSVSATVVHLTMQPTGSGKYPIRAAAQAELDKRAARFLKKAELESLVSDKSIVASTINNINIFCDENCVGRYLNEKFGYQEQTTPATKALEGSYFLVFDI